LGSISKLAEQNTAIFPFILILEEVCNREGKTSEVAALDHLILVKDVSVLDCIDRVHEVAKVPVVSAYYLKFPDIKTCTKADTIVKLVYSIRCPDILDGSAAVEGLAYKWRNIEERSCNDEVKSPLN
jgi:hypothetical protein